MAVEYAVKYSGIVDEKFTTAPVTAPAVDNMGYEWVNAETVKVYDIPVSAMNDYQLTGSNRYGSPEEVGTNTQTMTLTKDRAFTFSVDRKTEQDTPLESVAAQALARQIRQVVLPELDKYRLATMVTRATTEVVGAVSKTTAYSLFMDANAAITDLEVPVDGRIAYVSSKFYKYIKQDESFTKVADMATHITISGVVGEVDGVMIIPVATNRLPANVDVIITYPVLISPVKLESYRVHENPPGINGVLVEGRIRYDAFVLNNKKDAIAYIASSSLK